MTNAIKQKRQLVFEIADLLQGGTSTDGSQVFLQLKTKTGDTVRCSLPYVQLERFQDGIRELMQFVRKRRIEKGLDTLETKGMFIKPRKIVDAGAGRYRKTDNVALRFDLSDGGFATFEIDDGRLGALIETLIAVRDKKRCDTERLRVVH